MARIQPFNSIENADKFLQLWDDVCNKLEISHLLIYGTALGFYRDGGYIKGDSDIDVRCICKRDKWDKMVEELTKKGVFQQLPHGFGFYKYGILMCIERCEKVGVVTYDDGWEITCLPYYDFETVEHNGRKYNIPYPAEAYFAQRYGADWKTPKLGGKAQPGVGIRIK